MLRAYSVTLQLDGYDVERQCQTGETLDQLYLQLVADPGHDRAADGDQVHSAALGDIQRYTPP